MWGIYYVKAWLEKMNLRALMPRKCAVHREVRGTVTHPRAAHKAVSLGNTGSHLV